ncbi:MAG: toprim domain-containing protein [Planctomycetaceae bacterium]|nr:toprim domain-containing protein [Planctomycetales bacterium]MCB9924547.1 toprim domain-containing protein [Planctomycetaceae bacterium]
MPQVSVEQVAQYYGATLPELKRVGDEIRTKCFLNCGQPEETGDRAIAIKASEPVKPWRCHHYGCNKGGNLVSLCDLLKPGVHSDGRPRGARFKEIAADLRAMVAGVATTESPPTTEQVARPPTPAPPKQTTTARNLPLARSTNERARALVNLDDKFLVDPADMNAKGAAYFRHRPFLSPEVCRKWRMGYLPSSTGPTRTGGTMRGKVVYPLLSERGEVLTWFGRDPDFEAKHAAWKAAAREGREPEKCHFVKGFQRGLELFGQHSSRMQEEHYRQRIAKVGVIVVEGPNDVIALDTLGVPAVGLCSNSITSDQVKKLVRFARTLAGGNITLMLDCDEEGRTGGLQALGALAQHCRVRLAWSPEMYEGQFRGRQPESLSSDEWQKIEAYLTT